jgi:tetratricopeptide (TPR) repeat protein
MSARSGSPDRGPVSARLRGLRPDIVLFLAALALRLLYLREIRGTPLAELLLVDSETYDRFARKILSGAFRGEEVYSMNVLYPYFLAGVYALFKGPWTSALPAQAFLDSLSCVLLYRVGIPFFGRAVALGGAALAVLYGPFIFYSGALLTPALIGFLGLLALFLLTRYERSPGPLLAIAAGLAIGLATLGRGNNLLLLPTGLVCFGRGRIRDALLFLAAGLSLSVLVSARNYRVEGHAVPIAANYAAFYIGNNPEATGLYTMPPWVTSARFEGEVLGTREWVSSRTGREVTLAESARILLRWGLDHVREEPGAALVRCAKKLYFFWNGTESPTNLNYHVARDFSFLLRALPVGFGIVAPLSLLGAVYAARARRRAGLLYLYAAVPLATCLVFFVSAEYRLPAVPVLLLFASYALVRLGRAAKGAVSNRAAASPEARSALLLALLLPPLFVFANHRTPLLRAQAWKRVDYLNFGIVYRERNEFDAAKRMLERSLELDPRFGPAHEAMAELYGRVGDDRAAARSLESARRYALGGQYEGSVTEAPGEAGEFLRIGAIYDAGRFDEALAEFRRLAESLAGDGERALSLRARNNVGLCLYKLGRLGEAEAEFRDVIREDPSYVKGYTNLARVCAARGEREEAARLVREALRLDPENPRIRAELDRLEKEAVEARR